MSRVTIDQVRESVKESGARATAWALGARAFTLGADITINPYPAGTRGYHSFLRGWFYTQAAAPSISTGGAQ